LEGALPLSDEPWYTARVDNAVEVRYAGVVVGRGALKELPDAAFVSVSEPLPVGTLVSLKIGDAVREARVDEVLESADPTVAGMRVRWGGARTAAAPSAPAAAPASGPTATAAPDSGAVAAPDSGAVAAPDSGAVALGDSGPVVTDEAGDEGSGAIPAPLSLAGGAQPGGGKRRRKRR
jgi:hypothetical protein